MKDIYIARPRDPAEGNRAPSERTLESYRVDGPWVVDCFDAHLAWKFTFYGKRGMSRTVAERKASLCQRIENDLKVKKPKKRAKKLKDYSDHTWPPGGSTCPDKPL